MELGIVSLAVFSVLAGRPVLVWRRKLKLRGQWHDTRFLIPDKNALKVIVLGDSISEGVGATALKYSYVGRIGEYITKKTGRPVCIANYAMAGATSDDVIKDQLPHADLENADLILLEIGVNDGHKPRGTQENLAKNMAYLLSILPAEKTVVSDLPFPKLRKKYQAIMETTLSTASVARAYPSRAFEHILPSLLVTAGDFWHPNNRGHELWFEVFRPGVTEVLERRKLLKTNEK
jgi:hypothetical protein